MPGLLETGASSALTPPSASGGASTGQVSPQVQVLQKLAQSGLISPDQLQGLVSFGAQPTTPQAPVRMGQPDIQYPKPQGSFRTVGERKRADEQALFHGIASTVKTAADYFENKKIRSMQMDTERLMGAMTGYNEAQAAGNKEAMQHNSSIINDMMSDPKKIKQFQKVFNVNLLGESKDKNTPEYKGFVTAFKKYKDDKAAGQPAINPMAQRLMQQMPQRTQADPRLQQLIAATKAGVVPNANVQLQQDTEMKKIFADAQNKQWDRESKERIADKLSTTADKRMQTQILSEVMRNTGRQGVAEVIANASKYRADKMYDSVMDNPRWQLMKDKLGKDVEDKSLNNFTNAVDKQMKQLTTDKKEVDAQVKADKSWFGNKELVTRQKALTQQIDTLRRKQEAITNYYIQKHNDGLDEAVDSGINKEQELDLTPEETQQLEELYK